MSVEAPFRTQVTVTGMSCPHCVMSVTEEIRVISGVSAVDARLDSGAVTVLADREITHHELAAVLAEAGYDLAD